MLKKLEDKFGNNYEFSIVYLDSKLPSLSMIKTECKKHNTETEDLFINILHKTNPCLQCLMAMEENDDMKINTRKKRNFEELINDFKEKHGDRFQYHDIEYSFNSMREYVWIKCKEHNLWFQQTPNNHLKTNVCCPKCLENIG